MESARAEDSRGEAGLKLRVASSIARPFGAQLEAIARGNGGRSVTRSIAAEDVSKDMVDTEARLKQRELLVQRLTEMLATRKGSVSELVQAERNVAAAQEEIDQARSWLQTLRERVATSTFEIRYSASAAASDGLGGKLADSVRASGSGFVIGVTMLLSLAILLAPWAALAAFGWLGWRWLRGRLPRKDAGG